MSFAISLSVGFLDSILGVMPNAPIATGIIICLSLSQTIQLSCYFLIFLNSINFFTLLL